MVDFAQVSAQDVHDAVAEYDELGQEQFLVTHGFRRSRGYELVIDGRTYDSKAILGVAHHYATGTLASSGEFSGGRYGAAKVLGEMGFEVTSPVDSSPEVIPATGSWREVSEVGSQAARDAWALAARPVLLDIARRYHATITYSELAAEVQRATGIRTQQRMHHWIGPVLERVAIACKANHEPNLSSLVIDSKGSVGAGYAAAVRTTTGAEPSDSDTHAAAERLSCHRHARARDLPADGGVPALSRQLAGRRERVRLKATLPPELRMCPSCFIALPASGQCDHCG
ncbi:hypothetical protein [Janibacter terrae]|uniref:hypothetical protein n=1 Tax=Janibacter terrae TaxID=103817 RepID=UPI00082B48C5|nr:hypothetical protein [Janibacter terrae]